MNFTQQPAASCPAGFTAAGLRAGVQIVGGRCADLAVHQASAAFEQVRPWAHHRPRSRDGPVIQRRRKPSRPFRLRSNVTVSGAPLLRLRRPMRQSEKSAADRRKSSSAVSTRSWPSISN